jgi:phage/plasmid primase-like uncharacterized protein
MILENLRADMASNGYQFKADFVIGGEFNRFKFGKGVNENGHCQVWNNGNDFYHAEYGDWKTGQKHKWNSSGGKPLNPTQNKQIKQAQQEQADKIIEDQKQASIKANEIYAKAQQSTVFNVYLKSKGFDKYQGLEHPARQDEKGNLIIPLSSIDGQIKNLQTIYKNGDKRPLKDGLKKGTFCVLGDLSTLHKDVYVCEGYATALSVYLAFEQKQAVVFAIDCGNLYHVLFALKSKYKNKQFINCADNDHTKDENAGIKQAKAIKDKLGIPFIYPDFIKGTDFDDLRQEKELKAVKERILSVVIDNAEDEQEPNTLDKILQGTELFKNDSDDPYITVEDGRTMRIDSTMFKNWLIMAYHKETDRYLKESQVKDVVQNVRSRAIFGTGNKKTKVFNRVGYSDNENIYIDLVDESFNLVQLSKNGWNVITAKSTGVKFETTQNMTPLPYPTGKGNIDKLWQHTNITKSNDKRLVLAWLINCLIPFGGYPILVLYGGQGTAKSTTQSNLRDLIDPSIGNLRDKKANADFLGIQAVNNYIVSLNNLGTGREGLSASEQNTLCNIALGGAISDRKKYTDYEESMKAVKNPIMMNGISGFVTAQDLISRSIIITLDTIDSNHRKTDSNLKSAFEKDKAEIFGALLDLTSKVLKILPTLKVNNLPRMAEFGKIGTALEQILDKTKGKFLDDYKDNQNEAIAEVLESEPIIIVLMAYLKKQAIYSRGFSGTWIELVKFLKDEATNSDISLDKLLPRGLSAKIRANEPALKSVGVKVKYLQRTKKGAVVNITMV